MGLVLLGLMVVLGIGLIVGAVLERRIPSGDG